MNAAELLDGDIAEASHAVTTGAVSAVELAEAALHRAEAIAPLSAFVAVEADRALAQARAVDAMRAAGRALGPLAGVPLAHKDMYYRRGRVSGCGTPLRARFVAEVSSTALRRLDAAGALDLGRLSMPEFASNPTGHNPHYGDAKNPWNPDYCTGGSSGGSGAAVGAGAVMGALGSDTGGSIRIPSALCGVTGIKPTYGRVSRFGAMPLSTSLDHVGPMARSARDCARLLSVLAGHDPADPTSSHRPVPDYEAALDRSLAGLRVGVVTNPPGGSPDPQVAAALDAARALIAELGCRLDEAELPDLAAIGALQTTIGRVEPAAALRSAFRDDPMCLDVPMRQRVAAGLAMPALRYAEAIALRGRLTRTFVADAFASADVLFLPVTPLRVPRRDAAVAGTPEGDPVHAALAVATRPFNYLGLPAMSVPCGFDEDGLPIAMQIVGRPFAEARLLALAHRFQMASDWHRRRPRMN